MSQESPIFFKYKDQESTPASIDELKKHLDKMGIRSLGGPDRRTSPIFLNESELKWARFEIIEANDTVVMEVDRKDGAITLCYLSRSFPNPTELRLQVTSKMKPKQKHPYDAVKEAEVDGIFPLEIKIIHAGSSSNDGRYLGFYGSDAKSGIEITWDGRVRLAVG